MTPSIETIYNGVPQVPAGFVFDGFRDPQVGEMFLSKFRKGRVEVSEFPWDGRNQPRIIVRPFSKPGAERVQEYTPQRNTSPFPPAVSKPDIDKVLSTYPFASIPDFKTIQKMYSRLGSYNPVLAGLNSQLKGTFTPSDHPGMSLATAVEVEKSYGTLNFKYPKGWEFADFRTPRMDEYFLPHYSLGQMNPAPMKNYNHAFDGKRIILKQIPSGKAVELTLSNEGLPNTKPFLLENIQPPSGKEITVRRPSLADMIPYYDITGRYELMKEIYGTPFPRIPSGYRKFDIRVPKEGEWYLSVLKDPTKPSNFDVVKGIATLEGNAGTIGPDHRRLILTKNEEKAPVAEKTIRAVRVIEYVGPESWVEQTLAKSYAKPDGLVINGGSYRTPNRDLRIRELSVFKEEVKK